MKWFYDLKISTKLISSFIIVALISGIIGFIGIKNMREIDDNGTVLYEKMTVPIGYLGNISTNFQLLRVDTRDLILADTQEEVINEVESIKQKKLTIEQNAVDFEKLILSDEMRSAYNEFINIHKEYVTLLDKIILFVQENKREEFMTILKSEEGAILVTKENAAIEKLVAMKTEAAKNQALENTAMANKAILTVYIFIGIGMFFAVALGFMIARIISNPVKKLTEASEKLAVGDVDVKIDMDTKDEIGNLAISFKKMVENIKNQENVVNKIAKGEKVERIVIKSEKDILNKGLNVMIQTIEGLFEEVNLLTEAINQGKLDKRGNIDKFNGQWAEIVSGINNLIYEFVAPINITSEYIERISKGDIPPKITDNPNGDFKKINDSLNQCIDAINALIDDTAMLVEVGTEGRLNTRADASKHGGDFGRIVQGINKTLDAVIEPVKEASDVLKEMSKGNLKVHMVGNYLGDHAEIKHALNNTISTIVTYINEISEILTQMAQGNLNVGINADYKGDFIEIKDSLNEIIVSLNEVLGDINAASEQVAAGSKQVSDSSQALSQGSAEQASSIEEITASITQIAAQTKQNALNSNKANELALTAKVDAENGNHQMKQMLKAMEEINESSANISKIIKVIDEIAFQTNILALNAAVEAARAGQHGKGFAVVAEEVRNLAARSANAAKETTGLIEGSIKKADIGTKITDDTAVALENIVKVIGNVANIVGDIASASNEQATGVMQVNQAIDQVSKVIQMNTATAEESAAASEELSSQSELLKDRVMIFKLKDYEKNNHKNNEARLNSNVQKMNSFKSEEMEHVFGSVAATDTSKIKITLDDSEFGKY
ncbi:methyl-accepting chemotaxis protein [Marinisporobacter balticus]|uniref:Methyl-accepting chemotaxis protein n=1 Tax=Marinisporobacter balticus TaxID=2018667 RepID=A0A4R2KSK5_9FIRM|nr:methyl-accepting chemotaxis protein [Marinisporobacter balticus]TCO73138.1 methyl-accepting chemotaxis protein [Marinisporobacter balticus]